MMKPKSMSNLTTCFGIDGSFLFLYDYKVIGLNRFMEIDSHGDKQKFIEQTDKTTSPI